jgi:antitoxin PrlF
MASSTLTSKGQVTIPREIRTRLGLREGDRIAFHFDEQGNLLLRQDTQSPLGRLPGLLKHLAKDRPVTIEEMKQAVKQGAVERFERSGK